MASDDGTEPRRQGHPIHCPQQVTWKGVHVAEEGKRFSVESCGGHRWGLDQRVRVGRSRELARR